jgi:hypothetical protein
MVDLSKRRWVRVGLVVLLPLAGATACNSTTVAATVNYMQIGACNGGFKGPDGSTKAPGSGRAFVVFRVTTVVNPANGAGNFTFDPELLYLKENPALHAVGYYTLGWKNPRAVEKRPVKPGTTETFNGTVTIEVEASGPKDGATNVQNNSYFLLYDTPPGAQGVAANRTNASQTAWSYTNLCATIEQYYPNP